MYHLKPSKLKFYPFFKIVLSQCIIWTVTFGIKIIIIYTNGFENIRIKYFAYMCVYWSWLHKEINEKNKVISTLAKCNVLFYKMPYTVLHIWHCHSSLMEWRSLYPCRQLYQFHLMVKTNPGLIMMIRNWVQSYPKLPKKKAVAKYSNTKRTVFISFLQNQWLYWLSLSFNILFALYPILYFLLYFHYIVDISNLFPISCGNK